MLKQKRKKKINLRYGLLVDTKNKQHNPTIYRPDARMDWFENKSGVGGLSIRFSVSDFGTSQFKLFGSDVTNGAGIFVDKANNKIRYKNTNGTLTTETVFNATLQLNAPYILHFIKYGEFCRAYLATAPLTISSFVASGLDRITTNPFTFGNEATNDAIFTVYDVIPFSGTEIDRKAVTPYYSADINTNSDCTSLTGWTGSVNTNLSMVSGRIYAEQPNWNTPALYVGQNVTLVAGKTYQVDYDVEHGGSGFNPQVVLASGGNTFGQKNLVANTRNVGSFQFTATQSTISSFGAGRGISGGATMGEFLYIDKLQIREYITTETYTNDIDSMSAEGNHIPTRLHPYVAAHYPQQEKSGSYGFDCVEDYNWAKNLNLESSMASTISPWSGGGSLVTASHDTTEQAAKLVVAGSWTNATSDFGGIFINNVVVGHTYNISLKVKLFVANGADTGSKKWKIAAGNTSTSSQFISNAERGQWLSKTFTLTVTGTTKLEIGLLGHPDNVLTTSDALYIKDVVVTDTVNPALKNNPIHLLGYEPDELGTVVPSTAELIPDPTFQLSSGLSSTRWTVLGGWTLATGSATCTADSQYMYTDINVKTGVLKVEVVCTMTTGSIGLVIDNSGYYSATISTGGTTVLYIPAFTNTSYRIHASGSGGCNAVITSFSIKQHRILGASAKIDIYTKGVLEWWKRQNPNFAAPKINAFGEPLEAASGLPELKGALKLISNTRKLHVPASAVTGIGTGNWAMHLQFYCHQDVEESGAGDDWIMSFLVTPAIGFTIYKGWVIIGGTGFAAALKRIDGGFRKFRKGLHTLTIQKKAPRVFDFCWDGRFHPVDPDQGWASNYPDFDWAQTTTGFDIYSNKIDANKQISLVSFGIRKDNYTTRQLAELHANGGFQNPADVATWECFVQAGNYDSTNSRFTDFSGKSNHITQTGYTANELNPAHADYVIKSIENIRLGI